MSRLNRRVDVSMLKAQNSGEMPAGGDFVPEVGDKPVGCRESGPVPRL
jgi:hypothetical protein